MHNHGKDDLGKFDTKVNEALFIRYSFTSKAFQIYNKRALQIEKLIHVVIAESSFDTSKKTFQMINENLR